MLKEQRDRKQRQKREEKSASFGGTIRDSVPEDELSGGGARHSQAESIERRWCVTVVGERERERKVGFTEKTAMRHRRGG